ncbi:UNVERIFIED_CONTAM: hypothetical protein HDU68_012327 [Siphonaria sp. JEL0065]|nr:hypothetical protein HDU68_012327 [Siphonaria sp. JEL0065]
MLQQRAILYPGFHGMIGGGIGGVGFGGPAMRSAQIGVVSQPAAAAMPPSDTFKPSEGPLTPPNHDRFVDAAAKGTTPYTRTTVLAATCPAEHAAVTTLFSSFGVVPIQIDRITNPSLSSHFDARRSELLKHKSRNAKVLQECGLTNDQIDLRLQTQNLADKCFTEYAPNCALLFHCSKASVDDVLAQGLDCRMGMGGLLGRGIYFADDPRKSMGYDANATIFVFQVLLGDCLFVSVPQTVATSVREPQKTESQKRNKNDMFFDSIVAQPGGPNGPNEYVIYNSHQCVPVYAVSYSRASLLAGAAVPLPPFVWKSPKPNPFSNSWKFSAPQIFAQMSADIFDKTPALKPVSLMVDDYFLFSDSSPPIEAKLTPPKAQLIQWKCSRCHAMVDDDFLECLSCGADKPPVSRAALNAARKLRKALAASPAASSSSSSVSVSASTMNLSAPIAPIVVDPSPIAVPKIIPKVRLRESGGAFVILDSDDEDEPFVARKRQALGKSSFSAVSSSSSTSSSVVLLDGSSLVAKRQGTIQPPKDFDESSFLLDDDEGDDIHFSSFLKYISDSLIVFILQTFFQGSPIQQHQPPYYSKT